jgi:DNA-binding ferritin-like protein
MGFALLSGRADVVAPLVLAVEVAYLGFLGTHPKFQKYVEAQEAKEARQDGREVAATAVRRMLVELPKDLVRRFEAIRTRCTELRQIAQKMRDPGPNDEPPPLDDLQLAGLDRLLWMYLRLLFTQHSLSQFLEKTSVSQIEQDILELEERLKGFSAGTSDVRQQRLRKVVEDDLATSQARLANYKKAEENHELMSLEIKRLENTIHSLSELAVNRQEPEFISGQIDQVANSMVQTERTMGELAFVTGLKLANEEVPSMLRTNTVPVSE